MHTLRRPPEYSCIMNKKLTEKEQVERFSGQITALGERVKLVRKYLNLSQVDFCAPLSTMSRYTVSRIENGHNAPTIPMLLDIAEAYNIDPSAFVQGLAVPEEPDVAAHLALRPPTDDDVKGRLEAGDGEQAAHGDIIVIEYPFEGRTTLDEAGDSEAPDERDGEGACDS